MKGINADDIARQSLKTEAELHLGSKLAISVHGSQLLSVPKTYQVTMLPQSRLSVHNRRIQYDETIGMLAVKPLPEVSKSHYTRCRIYRRVA